jgi:hypothetical protein
MAGADAWVCNSIHPPGHRDPELKLPHLLLLPGAPRSVASSSARTPHTTADGRDPRRSEAAAAARRTAAGEIIIAAARAGAC